LLAARPARAEESVKDTPPAARHGADKFAEMSHDRLVFDEDAFKRELAQRPDLLKGDTLYFQGGHPIPKGKLDVHRSYCAAGTLDQSLIADVIRYRAPKPGFDMADIAIHGENQPSPAETIPSYFEVRLQLDFYGPVHWRFGCTWRDPGKDAKSMAAPDALELTGDAVKFLNYDGSPLVPKPAASQAGDPAAAKGGAARP
jgi:hypothetical protein